MTTLGARKLPPASNLNFLRCSLRLLLLVLDPTATEKSLCLLSPVNLHVFTVRLKLMPFIPPAS